MQNRNKVDFKPIPNELQTALGEVAVRYGQLEHLFIIIIRRVTGESWEAIFQRMRKKKVKEFLGEIKEAINKIPGDEASRLERFDAVKGRIENALCCRNNFVHCAWYTEEGVVRANRFGKTLLLQGSGQQHRSAEAGDVQRLAEELWVLFCELSELVPPDTLSDQIHPETNRPVEVLTSVEENWDTGYVLKWT